MHLNLKINLNLKIQFWIALQQYLKLRLKRNSYFYLKESGCLDFPYSCFMVDKHFFVQHIFKDAHSMINVYLSCISDMYTLKRLTSEWSVILPKCLYCFEFIFTKQICAKALFCRLSKTSANNLHQQST